MARSNVCPLIMATNNLQLTDPVMAPHRMVTVHLIMVIVMTTNKKMGVTLQ